MYALREQSKAEEFSLADYIRRQTRQGLFRSDAMAPELDPRVLQQFQSLVQRYEPAAADGFVRVYKERYGFWFDPIDAERPGRNWALSTPMIDMTIAASFSAFQKDLPSLRQEILESGDAAILSDTFSFTDGYGDLSIPTQNIVRLHSPVADINMGFEAYLETLTSERRKKFRRMQSDFDQTGLRFEFGQKGLSASEVDFVARNLQAKWGEDANYAFRQTLWALAVQEIRPEQILIMRVYDSDRLVFIQTMIVKSDWIYCQSITKDEENFFSGLAAYTDFKCVEALCGKPECKIFDPSCRTSLQDPESIGIAKRATVNKNCIKPIVAIEKFEGDILLDISDDAIKGKEA